MRVCLLNDSFPPLIDGVANTVINYARNLTSFDGCEAIVGTPRYPRADYSQYPFQVVPYRSINIGKLVEGYRAGYPFDSKVIRRITEFEPDVIHTHCPVASTMLARILRKQTGAPVVLTYHTKFDEDIAKAVRLKWMREGSAKFLIGNISACDEVWTVSKGAGENLKSLGFEGEYRVVVNGVDFPKGQLPKEETEEMLKEYDLPLNVPIFLYVGRMMTYKGLPLLIDALRILKDSGCDFRMVFVGGGADRDRLRKKCGNCGLDDRVLLTGPVRDRTLLRAWNTRADLFLFPSTYDTNGIVVREAAACALASLLIEGSCAAEGVTDGVNGFTSSENAEDYASKLIALCRNPERMREAGEHAMNELYLSWEDSVRRAKDLYEELLEKKRAGDLPRPKAGFSEFALQTVARVDWAFWTAIGTPRALIEGMLDNFDNADSL